MLFGLTNSPVTFQALINMVFMDLVAAGKVTVYLDDILIYSSFLDKHQSITHKVLQCLLVHNLYLCPKKCEFQQEQIKYLRLVISEGKVSMIPLKSVLSLTGLPPATSTIYAGFSGSPISTVDSSKTSLNSPNLLTTSLRKTPLGHGDFHNG